MLSWSLGGSPGSRVQSLTVPPPVGKPRQEGLDRNAQVPAGSRQAESDWSGVWGGFWQRGVQWEMLRLQVGGELD